MNDAASVGGGRERQNESASTIFFSRNAYNTPVKRRHTFSAILFFEFS